MEFNILKENCINLSPQMETFVTCTICENILNDPFQCLNCDNMFLKNYSF